jgi:tripartite-type tricarboxylate transporter receptor subunit TctC
MHMPSLVGAVALFAAVHVSAQTYPSRPVRLIVPFAPGGNVDITARAIAPGLSEALGQQVIVENRPGAGGTIATDFVAKAPPDGYTLLMASSSVMTNGPALYPKLPYDVIRDLAPVGRVSVVPLAIITHPSVPARTAKDLIALAKAQPGKLLMGNAGVGTTNHLVAELFLISTSTRFTLVPYKGSGQALIDLIAGHLDAHVDQISSALPYVKANRARDRGHDRAAVEPACRRAYARRIRSARFRREHGHGNSRTCSDLTRNRSAAQHRAREGARRACSEGALRLSRRRRAAEHE